MTGRRILGSLLLGVSLLAAQQIYRQNRWAKYEPEMQDPINDPPDAAEKTEFAFARLRFRSPRDSYWGRRARWGTDANKWGKGKRKREKGTDAFPCVSKSEICLIVEWWRRGELNPRPKMSAVKRLRAYQAQRFRPTPQNLPAQRQPSPIESQPPAPDRSLRPIPQNDAH